MTPTEIKKYLYKNKPKAVLSSNTAGYSHYVAPYGDGEHVILFSVPDKEAVNFNEEMPAQLLIRWLADIEL